MDVKMTAGFGTTFTSFILGLIPTINTDIQDAITFWFQLTAFTVTIVAGFFTICYTYKKLKDKQKL